MTSTHENATLLSIPTPPLSSLNTKTHSSSAPTMPPKPSPPTKKNHNLIPPPPSPLPTPALASLSLKYSYAIARGETGVLSFEPYKSLILPYWAFRTVPIAESSARALWSIFQSYVTRRDFVGADMARKFVQMGMTRARRYANWKGGRKYVKGSGELNERWKGEGTDGEEARKRREKEEASEVFKGYWRRCIEDIGYQELKADWIREKKEWEKKSRTERGMEKAHDEATDNDSDSHD